MHLAILNKILSRVTTPTPLEGMQQFALSAILAAPKEYGYNKVDEAFDFLVDTLEEMEEEAKHLDLITHPGNE